MFTSIDSIDKAERTSFYMVTLSGPNGVIAVIVMRTGAVTLGAHVTVDEAARAFWRSVADHGGWEARQRINAPSAAVRVKPGHVYEALEESE